MMHILILMVMKYVDNLFVAADKMRLSRDYLLVKIKDQERNALTHVYELTPSNPILLESYKSKPV